MIVCRVREPEKDQDIVLVIVDTKGNCVMTVLMVILKSKVKIPNLSVQVSVTFKEITRNQYPLPYMCNTKATIQ